MLGSLEPRFHRRCNLIQGITALSGLNEDNLEVSLIFTHILEAGGVSAGDRQRSSPSPG